MLINHLYEIININYLFQNAPDINENDVYDDAQVYYYLILLSKYFNHIVFAKNS